MKKKHRIPPNQMSLNLDVFTIETPTGIIGAAGESEIDAGLRSAIATTLDNAFSKRLTRDRVADLMAEKLGRSVTKTQLDQWAAPSQSDKRMPADALIAMIEVCDDFAAVNWVAHRNARRVLTENEAVCAEFGAMAVMEKHVRARQRKLEGQMDEALLGQVMDRMNLNQGRS